MTIGADLAAGSASSAVPANQNLMQNLGIGGQKDTAPLDQRIENFLDVYFGEQRRDVWVCGLTHAAPNWTGGRFGQIGANLREDQDLYFAIGLMRPEATRRASASVIQHHIVFADDVGTKVDPERWEPYFASGFPRPTSIVQTSPGNFTYIWRIDTPIAHDDETRVKALRVVRDKMGELGLSDPLPDDARYIRLPWGVNSKDKYRRSDGTFPTVLHDYGVSQDNVLNIEQAAVLLAGTDWQTVADSKGFAGSSMAGALVRQADMNNPEPIIQLALELGMNPTQVRGGVVEAECPNIAQHTTRADTGFAFLGNGLMECSHASCQHLRTPDFTRMMCDRYDAEVAFHGMHAGQAGTAKEFLARASFAYQDARSGVTVSQLADEAAGIAGRQQAVIRQELAAQVERTRGVLSAMPVGPVQSIVPAQIPPRRRLYGSSLYGGQLHALVAVGGGSKSTLAMVESVAVATGLELLPGEKPKRAMGVWYHNAEDDPTENQRKLLGVMQHYHIPYSALGSMLILTSGRTTPIRLAHLGSSGPEIVPGVIEWIKETIKKHAIGVLVLDPLGAMHGLPENSNEAMNLLLSALRDIAEATGVAIIILHHTSKAAASDMSAAGVAASRGASALTDGMRHVRQMRPPTPQECMRWGIPESERHNYVVVENGKASYTRLDDLKVLRRVPVKLGNGTQEYPDGDTVAVLERFVLPTAATATSSELARVQAAIAAEPFPPRADPRSSEWIGWLVAQALGLDAGPGLSAEQRSAGQAVAYAQVRSYIDGWIADGSLVRVEGRDPKRRAVQCIGVGTPAIISDVDLVEAA